MDSFTIGTHGLFEYILFDYFHSSRVKPKKTEAETVRRRSMRLQRVDPSGVPLPDIPAQPEPVIDEYVRW